MSSLAGPVYHELSEIPVYKAAQFQSPNTIRVLATTQDHVRNVHRPTTKTLTVLNDSVLVAFSGDNSEVVASMTSPSGKYLAVLREVSESGSPDKKRYVEVWTGDSLTRVEDVTDKHGQFYTDEFLSSISFSPSETKVVYVAEANVEDAKDDPLAKYRFIPDLGEAFNGRKKPCIFLLNFANDVGHAVMSLALNQATSPAPFLCHPGFASEEKIVALSYERSEDGRMLGVIYCPNRPASLWVLSLPSDLKAKEGGALRCAGQKLTSSGMACRSPRVFSQRGQTFVVFASSAAGGPHHTCSRIEVANLDTADIRILVDSVQDPTPDEFPGVYTPSLPVHPFVQPAGDEDAERFLVLSSVWRCRTTVLLVSLATGKVVDLTPDTDEHLSWTTLCTDGRSQMVCVRSALNRPPELVLGQLDQSGVVTWRVLASPTLTDELQEKLADLTVSVIPIPGRFPTETILVQAKSSQSRPCITFPHGGPHSASTTAFALWPTSFALDGYTVAQPNYTGSIGFGEKHVRRLLGAAGELDVADCIASVRRVIELGLAPADAQLLTGGSHGGFLVGNLLGRFPDVFRAATLRNPVTNLGETSTTDIPDWYFEELGTPYAPGAVMTPELYAAGFARSPMATVDAVRCPVQVHLGLKDQRVSLDQGKKFYHALKGRGKDVELFVFKDDMHALDSVEGSRASYHATKTLFEKWRNA